MKPRIFLIICAFLGVGVVGFGAARLPTLWMGKQKDGSFIVSSGQRIEPGAIAFDGRPIDLALHPSGEFVAVLNQRNVFLLNRDGVIAGSKASLGHGAGFRGAAWTPDGKRLFVSVSEGYVQEFALEGKKLIAGAQIEVKPKNAKPTPGATEEKDNPRPGGMAITRDGSRLFVTAADRNAVAEINLNTNQCAREYPTQILPFEVKLSEDEQTLLVSNWGGRIPLEGDEEAQSGNAMIVVDPRGAPASGTVSLINRATGETKHRDVGLHPTGIAVQGPTAYVANAASDTISVLNIPAAKVTRTLPIKWGKLNVFGSMPCALAIHGQTLYACNGGDNALCEIDLTSGDVRGFRPAGYFPTAVALTSDGKTAFVLNTKGNGSVRRTVRGEPGNAHDYQGTVAVLDLTADLQSATQKVAADNHWEGSHDALRPNLAVYKGAIKHVLYLIKENRTYDEIFGDLPEGNGDANLCSLGEKVMPNHRAIARQFTLFDNGYVSGTNSADGHAWSTQAMANDYLEHFYAGHRTYPDDGDCAMSLSSSGTLWDAAAKKRKSIRVYGEFCDDVLARFEPRSTKWSDMWNDRKSGANRIKVQVGTRVPGLKKYIHPQYVYWPLIQSDQRRADLFIEEYNQFSKEDKVPNLMILSLPCDHAEGLDAL